VWKGKDSPPKGTSPLMEKIRIELTITFTYSTWLVEIRGIEPLLPGNHVQRGNLYIPKWNQGKKDKTKIAFVDVSHIRSTSQLYEIW